MATTEERRTAGGVGKAQFGSDVIVEMMQRYGIDFAPTNLGGTFRGLLDSIVNFGDNNPKVIECLHEEIAVCVAAGYARVTDRPLVALVHNVVGTLHASMGIYDAYAAHVPMIVMSGTGPMGLKNRRPWIDWVHTALVQGNLVRDYVKWDDQPHGAEDFPDSFMRAYRLAMTEPKGPVYIALDAGWQEQRLDEPIALPDVSQFQPPTPMAADPAAVRRVAELLAEADLPLIVAGRSGKHPESVANLVELADLGGIAVVDAGGSLNFPNTHPLDATETELLKEADLLVMLDVDHVENVLVDRNRYSRAKWDRIAPKAKVVTIGPYDVWIRSTITDFGRMYPTELTVTGDSVAVIPQLTQALRDVLSGRADASAKREARVRRCEEARSAAEAKWRGRLQTTLNEKPISMERIVQELWGVIKGERWIFAGGSTGWPRRLWTLDRPGSVAGAGGGAAALGSNLPRAVGAGLAAKEQGGFAVALNGDGDFFYNPASIWTAVHHQIPLLVIVLDNGGYIGEAGHVSWTSESRDRSTSRTYIATEIINPSMDIAAMARAQGAYADTVEDPAALGPALAKAVEVIKKDSTIAVLSVKTSHHG